MTEVRLAKPEDLADLRRVLDAAYAPYLDALGADPPPLTQDLPADIAAGRCLVVGDPPQGFAVARQEALGCWLENLAIAPGSQGRGLGRLLVSAVEAAARDAGSPRVILATSPALAKTRAFYAGLGYNELEQDKRRVMLEKVL